MKPNQQLQRERIARKAAQILAKRQADAAEKKAKAAAEAAEAAAKESAAKAEAEVHFDYLLAGPGP